VDLQRNKTSLHIVTSVGYSIEYYDARNNKYQVELRTSQRKPFFSGATYIYSEQCHFIVEVSSSPSRHTTLGRNLLEDGSPRRRALYLTTVTLKKKE